MTPTELDTAARTIYNAVSDTFYIESEMLNYMYFAMMILSREGYAIEATSTSTTTVAGTRAYSLPTRFTTIKYITYNGKKLKPITFREDDAITVLNEATTQQGTSQYYIFWNNQVLLRPIPDGAYTLKIFGYKEPAVPTIAGTLDVDSMYHPAMVDLVVSQMAAKDSNFDAATYYRNLWENQLTQFRRWKQTEKRQDSFASVQDEDILIETYLGTI